MPNGLIFVVSAPSGAGKTTLCRALIERENRVRGSISCTTRKPRKGEVNKRDYFFMSDAEFMKTRDAGGLLEWAGVHGHYYGTPKSFIDEQVKKGVDVVLNIDWQGAKSVKALYPDSVRVYVCPPSYEELEKRLRGRAQDDETTIQKRLAAAKEEMRHLEFYDYLVVNEKVKTAVDDLQAILRAERRRLARMRSVLDRWKL